MADYTCPQCGGESDVAWAEEHWHEVDGKLCCCAYCAAIQGGDDEEEAQGARASQTEGSEDELRSQRVEQARAILEAEGEL